MQLSCEKIRVTFGNADLKGVADSVLKRITTFHISISTNKFLRV